MLDGLDEDEQHRVVSALIAPDRVDGAVIGHIEAVLQVCTHQDDTLGPQAALDTVLAQRNLVRALLPHIRDNLRPRLLSLYADLCGFAGWLAYDLGNYAAANDLYETGRAAAHQAQDSALAALILCNMSQTATWQGDARVGIDHAVAAQRWAAQSGDVRMHAYTYDVAARAFALDGQQRAAFDAVRHARRTLDNCHDDDETRAYFLNLGLLASTESGCLLRLGDARHAERAAEQAFTAITSAFVRNRAFATLRLGVCRLKAPRPDLAGAAEAFTAAAQLATHNRSVRLASQLVDAWQQLKPWHATPEAAAVRDQLASSGIL